MFKRLMLIVATCMTLFSISAHAQSSFSMGVATGVPVGTYGAAGAAVHTMMMDAAIEDEARAVAAMTPQEQAAYAERSRALAQDFLWFLYALAFSFLLMAFVIEPIWSIWLCIALGFGWGILA